MAQAKALYESGELAAAIEAVTSEVKANPTDMQRRTFLFELLAFAGEWDRAEKQLDVIANQSTNAEIGVQAYRHNIKAERERRRLFADGLQPHFLSEPPVYVDLHLAAINRVREGNFQEAREALDRAEEDRPAFAGKLNGQPIQDFRDADDFVGPVLELVVQDKYAWLPLEQVKRMAIAPPKSLRDLIWPSARIESTTGTVGEVFMLALYEGSSAHESDAVRLGRMTDWRQIGDNLHRASGLRLFLADDEDKAIFEVKSVEFDATEAPVIVPGTDTAH